MGIFSCAGDIARVVKYITNCCCSMCHVQSAYVGYCKFMIINRLLKKGKKSHRM